MCICMRIKRNCLIKFYFSGSHKKISVERKRKGVKNENFVNKRKSTSSLYGFYKNAYDYEWE